MSKTFQVISILSLTIFLFLTSSCKKEDNSVDPTPVVNVFTTGTWMITYMADSSYDCTYEFADYSFVFNTNGELTAATASGTTVGSWYAENDDDDDDEFRIALGNTPPLDKLSRRWHVRSISVTEVDLYDEEEDHGHEYELKFKKL